MHSCLRGVPYGKPWLPDYRMNLRVGACECFSWALKGYTRVIRCWRLARPALWRYRWICQLKLYIRRDFIGGWNCIWWKKLLLWVILQLLNTFKVWYEANTEQKMYTYMFTCWSHTAVRLEQSRMSDLRCFIFHIMCRTCRISFFTRCIEIIN